MIKTLIILTTIFTLIACASKPEKIKKTEDVNLAASLSSLIGEPKKVDPKILDKFSLGSKENPIRVNGPKGQRNYLSRLVCENNETVSAFNRKGSVGRGPFGTTMDVYEVICDTNKGVVKHDVFLDMYHANYIETRPAAGFIELKPAK
ncbi:MAG: hypothetical protein V4732_22110 [Pseudomonadota bacterium]